MACWNCGGPDHDYPARCAGCGKPLCGACGVQADGSVPCKLCDQPTAAGQSGPSGPGGFLPAPAGGQGHGMSGFGGSGPATYEHGWSRGLHLPANRG